ncbi:2182_t:CDS:1, partial [Funneliformis mosseae]
DINTGEIGRVVNSDCAVQCLSNYGPIFGSYVTNLSVFKKADKVSPEDQNPEVGGNGIMMRPN